MDEIPDGRVIIHDKNLGGSHDHNFPRYLLNRGEQMSEG
jgi:hypothetical protein